MQEKELYTEERRQQILEFIQNHLRCSVNELSTLFKLTPATIRSDLRVLEQEGHITRTHGGAVLKSKTEHEDFLHERKNDEEKKKIAKKAITFINDGDSIALDTGTTAIYFAKELIKSDLKNLKIITADFTIMHMMEQRTDFEVIGLGGKIRHGFHFCYGDMTLQMISQFRVDKFILTTSAIDLTQGLSTPNIDTANLKAKLMSIAKEVYLLVDYSKFNKICFSKFAEIKEVTRLIADDKINDVTVNMLEDLGVATYIAK